MTWYFWILLLLVFVAVTHLMKILFNAKTYVIFSMISSKKAAKILDKFKNESFWRWISQFGLFLGFGFLGILYWYFDDLKQAKNKNRKKTVWKICLYTFIIFLISLGISSFLLLKSYLWTYYINIAVFTLFGFAGFGILLMIYQAILIIGAYIGGRVSCPGVAPVIPGITVPGTDFKIPFFEGWIALIVIMVVHELAHGVLARMIGIKVKSFGLLLAGIFPIGAFTEPDEEQLKKAPHKDQILVYSSGPALNLIFAFLVFLVITFAFFPLAGTYMTNVHSEGVESLYVTGFSKYTGICNLGVVSKNYTALAPLYKQLDENSDTFFTNYTLKVVSVDDENILTSKKMLLKANSLYDANKQDANFVFFVQDVNKEFTGFQYPVTLNLHSDKSFGFKAVEAQKEGFETPFGYDLLLFISTTLYWIALLSFMIGLFNFIPTKPLDGGLIIELIARPFIPCSINKEKGVLFVKLFFVVLILAVIFVNVLPLLI